jgi:hypothetical protein
LPLAACRVPEQLPVRRLKRRELVFRVLQASTRQPRHVGRRQRIVIGPSRFGERQAVLLLGFGDALAGALDGFLAITDGGSRTLDSIPVPLQASSSSVGRFDRRGQLSPIIRCGQLAGGDSHVRLP